MPTKNTREQAITGCSRMINSGEAGNTDVQRLQKLIGLFDEKGDVVLAEALQQLFPEAPDKQAALRGFRSKLKAISNLLDGDLEIRVDSKKRSPPEQRRLWLNGSLPATESIQALAQASNPHQPNYNNTDFTELQARPLEVRLFVSYARKDGFFAEAFLKQLQEKLKYNELEHTVWIDKHILIGEDWDSEIHQAMEDCEYGLLLFSEAFFQSDYITQVEIVELQKNKQLLPVAMRPFDLGVLKEHKLDTKQVYFHPDVDAKICFEQCQGPQKAMFVNKLAQQIKQRLEKKRQKSRSDLSVSNKDWMRRFHHYTDPTDGINRYQRQEFVPSLARLFVAQSDQSETEDTPKNAVNILDKMKSWARTGNTPVFALLGDYGTGKTFACKMLAWALNETPEQGRGAFYLDLRYVPHKREGRLATLEEILAEAIRLAEIDTLSPADIIKEVRQGAMLMIFDGLDEKLVHLAPAEQNDFFRELMRIIRPDEAARVLFSCRTHLFESLANQNAFFCGPKREQMATQQFQSWELLPFNAEQIRTYLSKRLRSQEEVDSVLAMIPKIHNLSELAKRPLSLSLMVEHLPAIEEAYRAGEPVNAARLYDMVAQACLRRDNGKHQLLPRHKQLLMEDLAAAFWRDQVRAWPAEQLNQWLEQWLVHDQAISRQYQAKAQAVLEEDLRNSTFVVRIDEDQEQGFFRFAHTSLQEFFLARYLQRCLEQGDIQGFAMPMPSVETLVFLGQLLEVARAQQAKRALKTLNEILAAYQPEASELALRYWLEAHQRSFPQPNPKQVDFSGADLSRWKITGKEGQPLDLRRANFTGARLYRAKFRHVNAFAACFNRVFATQSVWLDCQLRDAQFTEAIGNSTVFRHSVLERADFSNANLKGSEWLFCQAEGVRLPETQPIMVSCQVNSGRGTQLEIQRASCWLRARAGHSGTVSSAVFSGDGKRILTASYDYSARVWDAATGTELLVLSGHGGRVNSAVYSADGACILIASDDRSARVWDASTGTELLVLSGYGGRVNSAVYSADGARILTASYDGSARVWDASTGTELLALSGYDGRVSSAVYSADGARILTASYDGNARVWDAATGTQLLVLSGHGGWVNSAVYSADGARILTASDDGSARVWDAATGTELLVLSGHDGRVFSAVFSADGERILTASTDGSARVWDASTGTELLMLSVHHVGVISAVYSVDGERILTASYDGSARVWDATTGTELLVLNGHRGEVISAVYSADDERILTASDDGSARVWGATTGTELLVLSGHDGEVISAVYSADGERILTASAYGSARVWDATTGTELLVLSGHRGWMISAVYSADGECILTASNDGSVRVWDATTGAELLVLSGHRGGVNSAMYSADGERILTASDDRSARVWDATTGTELLVLSGHGYGVNSAVYSGDGERILTASDDGSARVWDASTGTELRVLSGHGGRVFSAVFSADGERILTSSADGSARVWDASTGTELLVLRGNTGSVYSAVFSNDDRHIMTFSADQTVRWWDTKTGQELRRMHFLPENQTAVIDSRRNMITAASPGAWAWLGWQAWDDKGQPLTLPAEYFGPMPSNAH